VLPPDQETAICDGDGRETGIVVESFAVPGKVALYLEGTSDPQADFSSDKGDTIGVRIANGQDGGAAFYIPGCARIDAGLRVRLAHAACVLFDGTLYTDDEMISAGVGQKTGARMGHISMAGENGAIAGLADLAIGRRIFVHINNTNPVLDEHSSERAAVTAAGWEIGRDGMEIEL
jgi:pyrroloquinoline quinone biosynthesis protein B